ncbi:threonine-phosphate decarboxylase CobD [Dethiothermospora halolimnae]|uniref:threonine-phosphate decarboxylase CobD n=1 Tax=Dethiothermospora halolimnae TaxID=3114390 RepID=UPI003CCBB8C3
MNKHGGYFGENRKDILDFSVNVNPLGASDKLYDHIKKNLKSIITYPEIDGESHKKMLSNHLNIKDNNIILGNGATELIYLFARATKPQRVLIIEPTFTEYKRGFRLAGSDIFSYISEEINDFKINKDTLLNKINKLKPDVVVLCNPNNPTGIFTNKNDIKPILNKINDINSYLFVDESFIDFVDKESYIELIDKNNLFILRSMTKFYAIPGLRLGYGLGGSKLINKLNENKEPWTLNSLALNSLEIILKDNEYMDKTLDWYNREKKFLWKELNNIKNIKVFYGEANFFLIKLKELEGQELKKLLIEEDIYIRTCEDFDGLDKSYIRTTIRSHNENVKLIETLKKILGE